MLESFAERRRGYVRYRLGQLAGVQPGWTWHGFTALPNKMGLGHERFREDLMGWASDSFVSESNHRNFYRHWAELMQV